MATELDGEELESISSQVEVLRKHLEVGWRSQTQCRSEKGKKKQENKTEQLCPRIMFCS